MDCNRPRILIQDQLVSLDLDDLGAGVTPNQYSNPNNPAGHHESAGPEIWANTVDAVMVVEDGKPVRAVTRADLMSFLVG